MSSVWKHIDQQVAATQMPEHQNRMVGQFITICLIIQLATFMSTYYILFRVMKLNDIFLFAGQIIIAVLDFCKASTSCLFVCRCGYYVTIADLQVKCNIILLG